MKKILIIHSAEGNLDKISRGIKEGAVNRGYNVDVLSTEDRGRTVNFHPYDLVVVGSPTKGVFRGSIAEDLPTYLRDCKRTQGQEAIAFVTPRFFATSKALKSLMGQLEKLGCIVNDFRSLGNYDEAVEFGKGL